MSPSRQPAAIIPPEVDRHCWLYSLMGDDEQKALLELLNKKRQPQKPLIEQYGDKWIKELGNGVLASFFILHTSLHFYEMFAMNARTHYMPEQE